MRFAIIFLLAFINSCSSEISVNSVDAENYDNMDYCWIREDKFKSFVVVHEESGKYYPYFISPWCSVEAEGYPEGYGFIPYIKTLKFSEDGGALRRASLFDHNLEATAPTHTPLPTDTDPIYIYLGSIDRLDNNGFLYYRLSAPKIFHKTPLTLKALAEKNPKDRLKFFKYHSNQ